MFSAVVSLLVFETVRRRHLHERYAILWLGAAPVPLVLAADALLSEIACAVGIMTPSNAFVARLLFCRSCCCTPRRCSRLSDETRALAQRLRSRTARTQAPSGFGPGESE